MSEALHLKYRPKVFSDMVGQKVNALVLAKMVEADDVPAGLLFVGVRGSGKTSAARIIAESLDAGDPIEVDAASNGSVQDVRELIDGLRYGNSNRVVIWDEAHSMSREAFNALLKTLEEPPAGVVFILVTTEPDKIPGTVKSRLTQFTFRKISVLEILSRLLAVVKAEGIEAENDLLKFLAERADGSMRDALVLLDQCRRAGISTREGYLALAGEADVGPLLVRALLTGDHAHIFDVADSLSEQVPDPSKLAGNVIGVLKDILVIRSGGEVEGTDESKELRKELARSLEVDRVMASLKLLWDLRTRARQSGDPKSNLDLALILVSEVFTRGRQTSIKPVATVSKPENVASVPQRTQESRRLTLDEL